MKKKDAAPKYIITKAQILHIITVLVIVPISGYIASWVPRHFPGLPPFTDGQVTALFITGASAAIGIGIHYLHGWQLWERTIGQEVDVEDNTTKLGEAVHQPSIQVPVVVHIHGDGRVEKEPQVQQDPTAASPAAPEPVHPQAQTTPPTPESQAVTGV